MKRDLTSGSVLGQVLSFALPLALAMASHAAFNLVDLALVGRLGEAALAGVHLGSTVNFFPMILGNGISIGAIALVSRWIASREQDRAARVANLSLLLMLGLGIVLGVLGYFVAEPLVRFQNAKGESLGLGTEYLEIMSLGTVTMFLLMHCTGLLRGIGNAAWTVYLLVGSNLLNIVLDIVLIFGWDALGMPAFGVKGAAWATVVARALGALVGMLVLAHKSCPLRPGLALPRDLAKVLTSINRLGIYQSLQMFVRAAVVVSITIIAGSLEGQSAHGALSIVVRLDTLVLFAGVGWASGATALIGQNLAKGLHIRCHDIARVTALSAAVFSLIIGVGFLLFSRSLFGFFSAAPSQELVDTGQLYFMYLAFSYPAATASFVLAGAMNGAGKSAGPMLMDLFFFGLPLQISIWVWKVMGAPGGLAACWFQILAANWLLLLAYLVLIRKQGWLCAAPTDPAKLAEAVESP